MLQDDSITEQQHQERLEQIKRLKEIEPHRAGIERWCGKILRNQADVEDAAQDVIIKASRATFDGRSSLTTWLYRIAENHCLNLLRRKAGVQLDDFTDAQASLNAPLPTAAVDQQVFLTQILDEINARARARRPPWDGDDHMIFEIYHGEEPCTFVEIAKIVGMNENTVKYRYINRIKPVLEAIGRDILDGKATCKTEPPAAAPAPRPVKNAPLAWKAWKGGI